MRTVTMPPCLGAPHPPLICTTYFLSFALAEFTEKKRKKKGRGKKGGKKKETSGRERGTGKS